MGDPKKFRKKYKTPIHPWKKSRIDQEGELSMEFGLQNKKEQWRMNSVLKRFKDQAKKLIANTTAQGEKEIKQMMDKLNQLGVLQPGAELDDILGLEVKDILERRLQTLVFRKGLARSMKQARQFIVHRHICINDKEITFPSYLVKLQEEPLITFRIRSPLKNENHPERPPSEQELVKEELEKVKGKKKGSPEKEDKKKEKESFDKKSKETKDKKNKEKTDKEKNDESKKEDANGSKGKEEVKKEGIKKEENEKELIKEEIEEEVDAEVYAAAQVEKPATQADNVPVEEVEYVEDEDVEYVEDKDVEDEYVEDKEVEDKEVEDEYVEDAEGDVEDADEEPTPEVYEIKEQ